MLLLLVSLLFKKNCAACQAVCCIVSQRVPVFSKAGTNGMESGNVFLLDHPAITSQKRFQTLIELNFPDLYHQLSVQISRAYCLSREKHRSAAAAAHKKVVIHFHLLNG
jgi:hypothetical protein